MDMNLNSVQAISIRSKYPYKDISNIYFYNNMLAIILQNSVDITQKTS